MVLHGKEREEKTVIFLAEKKIIIINRKKRNRFKTTKFIQARLTVDVQIAWANVIMRRQFPSPSWTIQDVHTMRDTVERTMK